MTSKFSSNNFSHYSQSVYLQPQWTPITMSPNTCPHLAYIMHGFKPQMPFPPVLAYLKFTCCPLQSPSHLPWSFGTCLPFHNWPLSPLLILRPNHTICLATEAFVVNVARMIVIQAKTGYKKMHWKFSITESCMFQGFPFPLNSKTKQKLFNFANLEKLSIAD